MLKFVSYTFKDSTATTVAGGDPQSWARRRKRRFNKHKQKKLSKHHHGLASSLGVEDGSMLNEIEIRLMPLDKEMIDRVKSQGIKVNLSRPKKVSRKHRPKESAWQLSKNEIGGKKLSRTDLSHSLMDETDPLTDNMLDEINQNVMETDDILHDEVTSTVVSEKSYRVKEKICEDTRSLQLSDRNINSVLESNLNFKNDEHELSNTLNLEPSKILATKRVERLNSSNSGIDVERISPLNEDSSSSLTGVQTYNILDVTVEELDNALLKELPKKERHHNHLGKIIDTGKNVGVTQTTPYDFASEVRSAENEIHDMVSNTARVGLTSFNLDLNMAKNMLKQLKSENGHFYDTAIPTKSINRILLSYFYFVRLKDEKSCQELQGKP